MTGADPAMALRRNVPGMDAEFDESSVTEGSVLMVEGKPGREAFFVLEGQADVSIRGDVVATVGPGEFLGEMALLSHAPRSATVTARTSMRMLVIDPVAFGALLGRPAVARLIAESLAVRLRRAEGAPEY